MSFGQCSRSFCMYTHNETMNIMTHFLPAVYFTAQLPLIWLSSSTSYSQLDSVTSRWLLSGICFSLILDTWTSVIYHLYHMLGFKEYSVLLQYDLSSIVLVLFFNFMGYMPMLFADYPLFRDTLMYTIGPFLAFLSFFVLLPQF